MRRHVRRKGSQRRLVVTSNFGRKHANAQRLERRLAAQQTTRVVHTVVAMPVRHEGAQLRRSKQQLLDTRR
jgi:hypothetical protein